MSAPAFADPARESQAVFRAILDAIARPGTVLALRRARSRRRRRSAAAAAALLTLADFETPLWLAPVVRRGRGRRLAEIPHRRAARALAGPAAFALVDAEADALDLARFASGTADYPDRSTTIVAQLARSRAAGSCGSRARAAGRSGAARVTPAHGFPRAMAANGGGFPLGVDLILAAGDEVAALPRSTRIIGRRLMYVAVKGGERAIRNAHALLADRRRGDGRRPRSRSRRSTSSSPSPSTG